MIIRGIHLKPFAGTVDRNVDFQPGLNVVLGANEAGKSTLVRALRSVLFTSTSLTPARFRREMGESLPASGGDTIRVMLSFVAGDSECTVEKTWGGAPQCRLQVKGRGEFTDSSSVDARLKELVALNQGTYDKVLIAQQSGLGSTLWELGSDADVMNSFGDLLRKVIVETEGVSGGRMLDRVTALETDYFRRWDAAAGTPEENRGIERRWQKGVGKILEAYYELRSCERDLEKSTEYDLKIDEFVRVSQTLEQRVNELHLYCETHLSTVEDARKREVLELRRQTLVAAIRDMKKDADAWPRSEERERLLNEAVSKLLAAHGNLRAELSAAEEYEKQKSRRATHEQAGVQHQLVLNAETKLSEMAVVTEGDVRETRTAAEELKRTDVQIKAQQLTLEIQAKAPLGLKLQSALGPAKDLVMNAGDSRKESVGGQVVLSHEDWELTVSAGTGEVETLVKKRHALEDKLGALLERHKVGTLEELVARQMAYRNQQTEVEKLRAALKALAKGKSFEELDAEVIALPEVKAGRAVQEIRAEMDRIKDEGAQQRSGLQEAVVFNASSKEKYGTPQALQDRLLEKLSQDLSLEREISGLRQLPEGYDDARKFINEVEARRRELEVQRSALHDVQLERKEYEKNAPEKTQDELKALVRDAKVSFDHAVQVGNAYRRIRQELQSILTTSDDMALRPFQAGVEAGLAALTGGRYTGVEVEKGIPTRIGGSSGELPIGLLSSGTIDVLSIAVRMAMAEYYLKGAAGFLLMDDPLVNLDPDRQRWAAEVIRGFAGKHQVIVLTCHPSHAELLGGNRVAC